MFIISRRLAATVAIGCIWTSSAFMSAESQKAVVQRQSPRSVLMLDADWQLYPMPNFDAWPSEQQLTAEQIHQLKVPAPGSGWQPVHLPDDYVVRGDFSKEPNKSLLAGDAVCALGGRECATTDPAAKEGRPGAANRAGRSTYGGHGYLPLYPAWYQRKLMIPASTKGKDVWLDFGGVYRDAVVFVNGQFIAQHASGYTGFRLDVTSAVHCGEENSITVFVDPRYLEGWWYEGGGIYRHVSLIVADKLHIAPWGTFVDSQVPGTIHHGSSVGDRAAAELTISTTVRNNDSTSRKFTLVSRVIDPSGKSAAVASSEEQLPPGQEMTFRQKASLPDAQLWSLEHRNLYKLVTTLKAAGSTSDGEWTTFGVRTLKFDPEHGFFLNGKHVMIYGMCVHQDFPGVGIAAPDNLWQWRIEKLKEMGVNSYRTAHNPLPEAYYAAADRMGMLVMDETRHLGDTYFPKAAQDTPYSDLSDVETMVLQHRNHPSVIMWSLANEEGQQATPYGAKIFAATRDLIRKIDPSRPTTSAMNGGYNSEGFISVEDILGVNYHNKDFAAIHSNFPKMMIFGSEDVNAKTSRGTLVSSRPEGRCSEFGCDASFNRGPWDSWVPVAENPFVAGQFVWTGFDYRGEPNPFSWPAATSQTGIMDLAGFPKPDYYYWKAAWQDKPSVYVFPDWTLPKDSIGKDIQVRAYSNCDRVELLLNGKSLGVQDMPRNGYLDWHVQYAPGTLTAIGYQQGHEAARYSIRTAGAPVSLQLKAEVRQLTANGEDVAPIAVSIRDADGNLVPDADQNIEFTVSSAGTIAGVANGDPATRETNFGKQCTTFRGLCMVLVKAGDRPGAITIEAHAAGLKPARIVNQVVLVAPTPWP
ncbi:MAG TPA: glycoside hydrolase family 2 TIM barrel-domain containing protein [Terracidiphilus sp.]|nr:glycoside hydrolase family 2 TIM barrel-domain containing protein [Terracidiphilus sp.]